MSRVSCLLTIRFFALGLFAVLALAPSASAQCRYEATIIEGPTVDGETYRLVDRGNLNDLGQVCGAARLPGGDDHAFIWTLEHGFQFIPELPQTYRSWATAISNTTGKSGIGYVTGQMEKRPNGLAAFIFDGVTPTELGVLPGAIQSTAADINATLSVVGQSLDPINGTIVHAFRWQSGRISDIGDQLPYHISDATGINSLGIVVGTMTPNAKAENRAFLLDGKNTVAFPPVPGGISSYAVAINNQSVVAINGQIAPIADGDSVAARASFLWRNGVWTSLNSPFPACTAIDLNDAGVVIGLVENLTATQGFYFVWHNGDFFKIATLVVQPENILLKIGAAEAINNRGQILTGGTYFIHDPPFGSQAVKFLLTPVPALPGDTNCDGVVNINDLTDVILDWNNPGGGADLNFDLTVDIQDLLEVVNNWGS